MRHRCTILDIAKLKIINMHYWNVRTLRNIGNPVVEAQLWRFETIWKEYVPVHHMYICVLIMLMWIRNYSLCILAHVCQQPKSMEPIRQMNGRTLFWKSKGPGVYIKRFSIMFRVFRPLSVNRSVSLYVYHFACSVQQKLLSTKWSCILQCPLEMFTWCRCAPISFWYWSSYIDGRHFVCSAKQKLYLFNKLQCPHDVHMCASYFVLTLISL